jgi:hypothetical protein
MSDFKDELVEYAKKLASGHATEGDSNRVRAIGAALLKGADVPPAVVPVLPAPEAAALAAPPESNGRKGMGKGRKK